MAPKRSYPAPQARSDALEEAQALATTIVSSIDAGREAVIVVPDGSDDKRDKKKKGWEKGGSPDKMTALLISSRASEELEEHKRQCAMMAEKMKDSHELRKLLWSLTLRWERSLTARTKLNRNVAKISQFADWLIWMVLELVLKEFVHILDLMKSPSLRELFYYLTGLHPNVALPAREMEVRALVLFLCLLTLNGKTFAGVVLNLRRTDAIDWSHTCGRYLFADEKDQTYCSVEHRASGIRRALPCNMTIPAHMTFSGIDSKATAALTQHYSSWACVLWVQSTKIPISRLFDDVKSAFEPQSEQLCSLNEYKSLCKMTDAPDLNIGQHVESEILNLAARNNGVGLCSGTAEAMLKQSLPSAFNEPSPGRKLKRRKNDGNC